MPLWSNISRVRPGLWTPNVPQGASSYCLEARAALGQPDLPAGCAPARKSDGDSRQLLQQASRLAQVCRCETFGEAAVNRPQQRARLRNAILVSPKPGEARGGAQFPGERALPARPVERPHVEIRRKLGRVRTAHAPRNVSLNAQQFGKTPSLLGELRTRDRIADRRDAVRNTPSARQDFGKGAEECREIDRKSV